MSEVNEFDDFWISQGQDLVEKTFTNLNTRLNNYINYLKYLKGFFIISGFTTIGFYQTTDPWVFGSFILPTIFIYLATLQISVVSKVEIKELDLRSPLKINKAYHDLVIGLKEEVENARSTVIWTTIVVLISGTIAIYNLNKEVVKKEKETTEQEIKIKQDEYLFKIKNEVDKEFKKGQKLYITTDNNKISISAKLIKDKTIIIEYLDFKNQKKQDTIKINKLMDFKRDIDSVKKLLKTEYK